MKIILSYKLAKPIQTQAQCDTYAEMADAVIQHNENCDIGDTLWSIEEQADAYVIVPCGIKSAPSDVPTATSDTADPITALQSAQTDTDSLMVDQEYRLTLLELGISE